VEGNTGKDERGKYRCVSAQIAGGKKINQRNFGQ